jgi:hypothetical protein
MAGQRGKAVSGQRGSGERWHWVEAARGSAQSSAGAAVRGSGPARPPAVRRAKK